MKKLALALIALVAIIIVWSSPVFAEQTQIKPRGAAVATPATPTPVPAVPASTPDPVVAEPATPATVAPATEKEVAPIQVDLDQKLYSAGSSTVGDALRRSVETYSMGETTRGAVFMLRVRTERVNQKLNLLGIGLAASFILLALLGACGVTYIARRLDALQDAQARQNRNLVEDVERKLQNPTRVSPHGVTDMSDLDATIEQTKPTSGRGAIPFLGVILCLGLASAAQAQTPKPAAAAKTAATCTITAISKGSVVTKEQDAAPITISVKNCKDVESISVGTNATDIVFTDVAQKGNVVTAKVTAEASALTGPTAIKVTLGDGTEVTSPDAVYMLVLDMATAAVRNENIVAVTKTNAVVAKVSIDVAAVKKDVVALNTKVAEVASGSYTKTDAEKIISELRQQIKDLQLVALNTAKGQDTDKGNIALLTEAVKNLALAVERLGNEEVKKGGFLGIGGKKPMSTEAAEAAARIRKDLEGGIIK